MNIRVPKYDMSNSSGVEIPTNFFISFTNFLKSQELLIEFFNRQVITPHKPINCITKWLCSDGKF